MTRWGNSELSAKSLEQLKIDAKNSGWPWKIHHPNDERALLEGCYPDFESAERVRRFFKKCLVLPRVGGGNKPFHLLDWWYRDVIAPLFGWKRADGRRRYQKGFITTAKKSGKSTVLAGLPLYMMLADKEEEAEAYSAAVDRDQASIVFEKTMKAVRISPYLSKICRVLETKKMIRHDKSASRYEAISSDADSTEGKNPHLLIADEVHVWRDKQFFNSLMYGDIARRQPMFLMITTAGDDDRSIGFEEYQAAKALLDPSDPYYVQSTFAYIAEAQDTSKWDQPESWLQAQPSLRGEVDYERPRDDDDLPAEPVEVGSLEKLSGMMAEAKQTPRKQRQFIRYICNRWVTEVEDTWIDPEAWDECDGDIPDHSGDPCWGGLDLSVSRDLTSLCLAFPADDDFIDLKWWFWTPKNKLKYHEDQWRVPLRDWVSQGLVVATDGPTIDYGYIRRTISGAVFNNDGTRAENDQASVMSTYDLQELWFDPHNALELCEKQLAEEDGVPMMKHAQSKPIMNEPSKKFLEYVLKRKIRHGKNPVARWQARHVVVTHDSNGNIKPDKEKSRQKIDGIVAAIMAVGKLSKSSGEASFYDSHALEIG